MIDTALYIALGVAVAGLVALAAIPPISRRAARLTRRAMSLTTPLTYAETQAVIAELRARHAVETARLERRANQFVELQGATANTHRTSLRATAARDEAIEGRQEAERRAKELQTDLLATRAALAQASADLRRNQWRQSSHREQETASKAANDAGVHANPNNLSSVPAQDIRKPLQDANAKEAEELAALAAARARIAMLEAEVATLRRREAERMAKMPSSDTVNGARAPADLTASNASTTSKEHLAKTIKRQASALREAEAREVEAKVQIASLRLKLEALGGEATERAAAASQANAASEMGIDRTRQAALEAEPSLAVAGAPDGAAELVEDRHR